MNNNSIKSKLQKIAEILFEIKTNKDNIVNVLKEKQVIDIDDNPKLSEIPEIIKNIIICNHFGLLRVNSNLGHEGKWSIDDGITWYDFNYEIKVEIGTYEIIFTEEPAYKTPEPQTITIETGILTEITANYIHYGGLLVNSSNAPNEAKWSINQTTWYNFGETISEIEPGTYTIYFNSIDGYKTPETQTVSIAPGELTEIIIDYIQDGDVIVENCPSAEFNGAYTYSQGFVKDIEGAIYVNNNNNNNCVKISYYDGLTSFIVGTISTSGEIHPVFEITVPGTPDENKAIGGFANSETGSGIDGMILYVNNFGDEGGLIVNSNGAPNGSGWSTDNENWKEFEKIYNYKPGTYAIYFKNVEGYSSPSNNSVDIISGEITSISGNYAPLPASIQSEKTENAPDETGWSIDNGSDYYIFGNLISVNPGSYTIKFKDVEGYITPPNIEVELKAGESIIINDDKYVLKENIIIVSGAEGFNQPFVYESGDLNNPNPCIFTGAYDNTYNVYIENKNVYLRKNLSVIFRKTGVEDCTTVDELINEKDYNWLDELNMIQNTLTTEYIGFIDNNENTKIVVSGLPLQYSKWNTTYQLSQDGTYWYSDETPDDYYQELITWGEHPGNGRMCWMFRTDVGDESAFIYTESDDPNSIIGNNVEVYGADGSLYSANIEIVSDEADTTKNYIYTVSNVQDQPAYGLYESNTANGDYWEEGEHGGYPAYTNGTCWLLYASGLSGYIISPDSIGDIGFYDHLSDGGNVIGTYARGAVVAAYSGDSSSGTI